MNLQSEKAKINLFYLYLHVLIDWINRLDQIYL